MTTVHDDDRVLFDLANAYVTVVDLDESWRRIRTVAKSPDVYIHRDSIQTTYSDDLMQTIIDAKGVGFLCDEIARDQDPAYLERHLLATIMAHVDLGSLAGARVLDFGCGAGASTSILARFLPESTIVGVELEPSFLSVAEARSKFYGLSNTTFLRSPASDQLPDGLEKFDAIVLSAVFEHLLPNERRELMPVIWSYLRPGGTLFVDETPWRWFPIETHTTGIPLLNYLPPRAATRLAVRSSKVRGRTDWTELQRAGIRGATVREILRSLGAPNEANLLPPTRSGVDNYVDLWFHGYARGDSGRFRKLKRSSRGMLRAAQTVFGVAAVPYLSLAIRKSSD